MHLGEVPLPLLLEEVALGQVLGLEGRQVVLAPLVVDEGHQVGGEVDDLLELLGLQLLTGLGAHEQVGEPRAGAAQVPDVHGRRSQLDVAHPLAPHLRTRDLDAAALADDALEADALVLAAVALPVLGGTEDLLAEETVLLRLERPVVDGLGLLHLAVRPQTDLVRGGQADAQLIEIVDVKHPVCFLIRSFEERLAVVPAATAGGQVAGGELDEPSVFGGWRRRAPTAAAQRDRGLSGVGPPTAGHPLNARSGGGRPRRSRARCAGGRCRAPRPPGRSPRRARASRSRHRPSSEPRR